MVTTSILRSIRLKNIFHQLSKNWVSQILEGLFKLGKRSATTTWFLRHILVWGIVFVWEKTPFVGRLFPFWTSIPALSIEIHPTKLICFNIAWPQSIDMDMFPNEWCTRKGTPNDNGRVNQAKGSAAPFGWKSAVERSTTKNVIALEFLWELEPSRKHFQCLFQRSDLFIYLHFMLFSFYIDAFISFFHCSVSPSCGVGTSFWSRGKARVNKGNRADNKALL